MNNMTGDPNQETRPPIFAYEPYPNCNFQQAIDWSQIPAANAAPFAAPGHFNPTQTQSHLNLGNLSFCHVQTPSPAQFPFPSAANPGSFGAAHAIRCKRKTESPPLQPSKQHITEEKMAEHMSKLHINSETASSSRESENERTRRLYMCEEMRKLQSDSILPQSLLSRIQRPCNALVLWTPPRRLFPIADNPNNENNNEETVPDQNTMDMDNL